MVGVGQDLVDGLGRAVRPAGHGRRAEDAVGVLGERAAGVLAVDLRRAGDSRILPPVAVRRLDHDLRAADVGGERLAAAARR